MEKAQAFRARRSILNGQLDSLFCWEGPPMTRWLWAALAGLCFLFRPAPLRAADDPVVKRAVDKGVAFLKSKQQPDGLWKHDEIGATSLAALTLLECGVPADDPAIQK